MVRKKILIKYFEKGITYEEMLKDLDNFIQEGKQQVSKDEDELYKYSALNLHRYSRIQNNYIVSAELQQIIEQIKLNQNWLVLTEHWCGDSAQIIPYLNKMIELNSNIQMRFLFRDENLELMNMYLTNGKQSIPKIIAFSADGIELFQWGPRPKEAAQLFATEKEAGLPKEKILEKIHLWYGRNRGCALESEFKAIFKKMKFRS